MLLVKFACEAILGVYYILKLKLSVCKNPNRLDEPYTIDVRLVTNSYIYYSDIFLLLLKNEISRSCVHL